MESDNDGWNRSQRGHQRRHLIAREFFYELVQPARPLLEGIVMPFCTATSS